MVTQKSIDLTPGQLKEIKGLLSQYLPNTTVWAYGSRVRWNARPDSDLDLVAFANKQQQGQVSLLREAFEESNLPFSIDFFVWDNVPDQFKKNIQADYYEIQSTGERKKSDVMGSEWQIQKLQDVAEVIDSRHKTPAYSESGYPMVRVVDVKGGALDLSDTKKVDREVYDDFSRGRAPQVGDLVISRVGSYGIVSYVNSDEKFCLGQNTAFIIPKINSEFLYYQLNSPGVKTQIDQMVVGAVQKTISLKSIKSLEIGVPELETQKKIALILGALDKKIELNRQINTTLESMAQALFKSWFVDFDPVIDNALAAGNPIPDVFTQRAEARAAHRRTRTEEPGPSPLPTEIQQLFPSSFVLTEEMGWVPEGWGVKSLSDIIELIGGGTPKTSVEEYWGGNIPWFSVVDAPSPSDVFVIRTEKTITQSGLDNSSAKLLPQGTTIISARGTVGKCAVVAKPMAMNQSCYGLRGAAGNSDYFTYYTVLKKVDELQQRSHGSVFSTITRDTFKSLKVAACNPELTAAFDASIKSNMDRVLNNLEQNYVLSELRDSLLPKLLSGQLQIPDAEQQLAEVL